MFYTQQTPFYSLVLLTTSYTATGFFWSTERTQSVCYDGFGCYNNSFPFNNAQGKLPGSVEEMGMAMNIFTYSLYPTRVPWNVSLRYFSNLIDPEIQTTILIHGYSDNGTTSWILKMAAELLNKKMMNVLSLDWQGGASPYLYMQAVANTRLVGSIGAACVKKLLRLGVSPMNIHLIGHSLGAHVAGYIGKETQDVAYISRISGLDPAGPAFEGTHPDVRLDPTDAIFVDVTHTNTQSLFDLDFGITQPCGTLDFYPNGGEFQPGCGKTFLDRFLNVLFQGETFKSSFACSHLRATYLYTETINSDCNYKMYKCMGSTVISNNTCRDLTPYHCVRFGYPAVRSDVGGIFYFESNEKTPFCNRTVGRCT